MPKKPHVSPKNIHEPYETWARGKPVLYRLPAEKVGTGSGVSPLPPTGDIYRHAN